MTFYSSMNGNQQSWRNDQKIAGYQAPNIQEFGQGNSSVKIHHNPGGKSNFSLGQTGQYMEEDERFNIIKPGVSQPFGRSNYDIDEKFHQKTGTKNQSQIAFGNDQGNPYKQHEVGSFATYTKALEQEDPRYPKRKANFGGDNQNNQWNEPPQSQQKSTAFAPTSIRDRYLQEKAQQKQSNQGFSQQSNYSNQATYAPSSYGGQSQWNGSQSNFDLDSQQQYKPKKQAQAQQFQQQMDDNSWQKPTKSKKQQFENNQFVTKQSPFGLDKDQNGGQEQWYGGDSYSNKRKGGYEAQHPQQYMNSEQNRDNRPAAGPGAFTSVKYSGNPPGGKSSITF